jgi:hypothetical protein
MSFHRTWTSLWHFIRNCQEDCQGLDKLRATKIPGLNRIHTGRLIPTRTVSQKKQGTVKTRQKQLWWVTRLLAGHCQLKDTSSRNEWWMSHLWKVPRKRWISHTVSLWLWCYRLLKILLPGPLLYGAGYYQDTALHLKCRIIEGLKWRGMHSRSLKVAVQWPV